MNTIIDLFNDHKSERSFTDKAIDDATLDRIISTAWRAPTSVHSQQVSAIVTRDPLKRAEISRIAGGQPWIAKAPVFITFVLDMYKTKVGMKLADKEQIAHQSIESLIAGATDVGIALGSVMAAARSEGLGIVPIGGLLLATAATAPTPNSTSSTATVLMPSTSPRCANMGRENNADPQNHRAVDRIPR